MDEEHFIDRKERQQKNRVLDRQTSMQIDNASHKVNAAKEDKRRRDEQREKNKARETIKAKNHNDVSGLIAQHFFWCHENVFLLVCNVHLFLSS
jgi:hypothetical protein